MVVLFVLYIVINSANIKWLRALARKDLGIIRSPFDALDNSRIHM